MANLSEDPASEADITLDGRTSRAIRDGIGERLREMMAPAAPLPSRLQNLMSRLRDTDDAPSIVSGGSLPWR
jgi:hypothetical protein